MRLPGFARLVWAVSSRDFRVPELRRLPRDQRMLLDPAPIPIQARAHQGWASCDAPELIVRPSSGAALRGAYSQGLSPVEVVEKVLSAHASTGERSPFITVDIERAMDDATASAARWADGKPKGPLDGLIIPVKDEFHMVDHLTWGGTTYTDTRHATDAWVVRQLRQAGAVVLAKTHATEWGLNPCGVLEHRTGPRNVYSNDAAPGGSSTGSGVAVALGWAPSAVGTDGGGSIRIPASLNGVYGLKPTYIRIGRTGDAWGASTVAHIGPIGRSTADLVDQLEATAGLDIDDPLTRWAPDNHDARPWRAALTRGIRGARIGVPRRELADASPAIVEAFAALMGALKDEGAILVDVHIPLAEYANGIGALVIGSETAANLSDDFDTLGSAFGDELALIIQLMRQVAVTDLQGARKSRAALRRQMAQVLKDVDLIALPTTATTAPTYLASEDQIGILDTGATAAMTRFNFLANLTGLPAGTVPVGLSAGLPMGVQFVGDAWDEASVIAAMAHCERILPALPNPASFLALPG